VLRCQSHANLSTVRCASKDDMKSKNKNGKPKFLFKYREFNKTSIELLINQELWFPSPETLNDPFDCQTECHRIIESCAKEIEKKISERHIVQIKKLVDEKLTTIGVASFSKTKKNQLMWSHYADEHKGFCIGFHHDLSMLNNDVLGSFEVKYKSKHPFEEFIKRNEQLIESDDYLEKISHRLLESSLTTKYTNWQYEKEWRIIKNQKGAVKFNLKMVNSITFGLKMPDRDKRTLRNLLNGNSWNHLKWFETTKANNRFALEFNKIK
jgi:hypothetical protein